MKGLNIKALFVNHLEKMGFAIILLSVVLIWAKEYFGGAWARERRNPVILLQDIEKKKQEIDRGVWPEDKRKDFALVDFSERAATLLRPIDSSQYELSTEYFVPLNRPKEKAREPDYLAVESLDALAGHVILALPSLDEIQEGEEGEMPVAEATTDEDDGEGRFVPRTGTGSGEDGLGAGGVGGPAGGGPLLAGRMKAGGIGAGGIGAKAIGAGPMGAGSMGGGEMRMTSGQRPQGRFYVAVRGVWPIRQQLEKIQKAMHLPTTSSALDHLEILDFDLERQVATSGDDPWSKEWEKLDIQYAHQILDEVAGFDDEPLEMQVFDTVMTMPLPALMFGVWREHGTHPRVKNYILTPEGQQREKVLQARLAEEHARLQSEEGKMQGPTRGGFNRQSNDFRQMGNSMMRGNTRGAVEALNEMTQDMRKMQPGGAGNMTPADLNAQITAVGRLLLFRYFDFDVQPGYAYRYRVKLKVKNPNFERDPAEVIDPSVAEGAFRMTPESNISTVAVLPSSPSYFLKEVERNPLADENRRGRSVASVSIYEWHKKMGTQVYATIPLNALGQFLGGTLQTDVLDVAAPALDQEEYAFTTDDALLDVNSDTDLNPANHPDLILPAKSKGAKTVPAGFAPEALVVGGGGDLKVLAFVGETEKEKSLRTYAERERKPFKGMTRQSEDLQNPLDMSPADFKAGGGRGAKGAKGMPPGMAGGAMPAGNPRRKGGRDRGAGAGAMMPGMLPGMGAGAGAGPAGAGRAKSKP